MKPPEPWKTLPAAPLVRAVGNELSADVENHIDPHQVDHVLITMDAGIGQRILVAVNTFSKRNAIAGFDPRVRVGVLRETWTTLPRRGVERLERFDYAGVESQANVYFEHRQREDLQRDLLQRCRTARLLEAWGVPYRNRGPGIHQIHSRRASCAVPDDVTGRDGGLRFYFEDDRRVETLMFKFCGQP